MAVRKGQKIKSTPNNLMMDVEKLMDAARKSKGLVSVIAKRMDVSRQTVYNWMVALPDFKQAVSDSRDDLLDLAENTLFEKAIVEKDSTALIFLLKTLGKARGYIERVEQVYDVPSGGELTLTVKGSKSNLLEPQKI